MKKATAVIYISACIVCVIGVIVLSCSLPKKLPVSKGVTHSELTGVTVEIDGMYKHSDMTTLAVSWHNKTGKPIFYGELFAIERLEKGEWVDCALKEHNSILIGYTLQANKSVRKEYRISDWYDVTVPGTYRFRSSCHAEAGEDSSVWAEFTIES